MVSCFLFLKTIQLFCGFRQIRQFCHDYSNFNMKSKGEVRMIRRKLEDLNLLDDFLFQQLVSRGEDGENFCRILLETILGKRSVR